MIKKPLLEQCRLSDTVFSSIPAAPAKMMDLSCIIMGSVESILVVESGILLYGQQLESQIYALALCSERSLQLRKFFAKTQHGKRQLPVISLMMFGERMGARVVFVGRRNLCIPMNNYRLP